MKRRHAARTDENQKPIIKALLKIPGVTVETDHDDILVGYWGRTYWFELKSPDAVSKRTGEIKESSKRKSQKRLEWTWTGHYKIVSGIDEILTEIGIKK